MHVSIVFSVAVHTPRNYMGHDVHFSIKTEFKICNFLRSSLFKNISGAGMSFMVKCIFFMIKAVESTFNMHIFILSLWILFLVSIMCV